MKVFEFLRTNLKNIKIKASFTPQRADHIAPQKLEDTTQEDEAVQKAREYVKRIFTEQHEAMQARASKAHNPNCIDSFLCFSNPCWEFEPDEIVKHKSTCDSESVEWATCCRKLSKKRKKVADKDFMSDSFVIAPKIKLKEKDC
jgi:hypothetical protein